MDDIRQTIEPWHAYSLEAVREKLAADPAGLSSDEARARLERYGANRLPEQPPPSLLVIALRQFQSPLIYLLLAAAVVSLAMGDLKDAGFIAAVLLINAGIGGYQEWRAEQSSRALQKLLEIHATVARDGELVEIDSPGVVPGDVAWIESGDRVPADIRLTMSQGLEVDESLLTGESLAVQKSAEWLGEERTSLGDRLNMVFAGASIVRGRAKGYVVATGTATTVGQLARDVISDVGGQPPLIERMERFTRAVGIAIIVAAAFVALLGITIQGATIVEMFFFAVALTVSAIPEGLPASLTVALAVATKRMARRGVIVRRLAAVEGLGSCTLIASDKTGTLTCNELTVREICLPDGARLEVTGQGFAPDGEVLRDGTPVTIEADERLARLARAAVLCNEGDLHHRNSQWVWRGDAVDVALLTMAQKLGARREPALENHPQRNRIPFESERQFAASHHEVDGHVQVFVKGAPERVLEMCAETLDPEALERERQLAETLASEGYRVLALAVGPAPDDLDPAQTPPDPRGLELLGMAAMIDPLRPGVREAVAACHDAGITVWMVTGDHPVTALAISRDLGLADRPEQVVTGAQLDAASPEDLAQAVRTARVFARVTPRQKLELVEAAQQAGHFVAVTGDGVNDAPALRRGNIGVAMGKEGTDVARDAASLVISDDNFATIVAGVEEGRVAYDNIRKVIYLLISTGAAEVLAVGLAIALSRFIDWGHEMPLPLLPVQLLWLNLVTNGIQGVALAFEPSEGDVLLRKPRAPSEAIFNALMIRRTLIAAVVMGGVGFGAFYWMAEVAGWSIVEARNGLLLLMVLFENVQIGNCRSEIHSAFKFSPLRSPLLLAGALSAFLLHVAAMYTPWGQMLLATQPIDLETWVALLSMSLSILVVMEIVKWWDLRRGAVPYVRPPEDAQAARHSQRSS